MKHKLIGELGELWVKAVEVDWEGERELQGLIAQVVDKLGVDDGLQAGDAQVGWARDYSGVVLALWYFLRQQPDFWEEV